jgi:hypothetical protein
MFRLARIAFWLIVGFSAGSWAERSEMRSECASGDGQWTGTICVNSELLQ